MSLIMSFFMKIFFPMPSAPQSAATPCPTLIPYKDYTSNLVKNSICIALQHCQYIIQDYGCSRNANEGIYNCKQDCSYLRKPRSLWQR